MSQSRKEVYGQYPVPISAGHWELPVSVSAWVSAKYFHCIESLSELKYSGSSYLLHSRRSGERLEATLCQVNDCLGFEAYDAIFATLTFPLHEHEGRLAYPSWHELPLQIWRWFIPTAPQHTYVHVDNMRYETRTQVHLLKFTFQLKFQYKKLWFWGDLAINKDWFSS